MYKRKLSIMLYGSLARQPRRPSKTKKTDEHDYRHQTRRRDKTAARGKARTRRCAGRTPARSGQQHRALGTALSCICASLRPAPSAVRAHVSGSLAALPRASVIMHISRNPVLSRRSALLLCCPTQLTLACDRPLHMIPVRSRYTLKHIKPHHRTPAPVPDMSPPSRARGKSCLGAASLAWPWDMAPPPCHPMREAAKTSPRSRDELGDLDTNGW